MRGFVQYFWKIISYLYSEMFNKKKVTFNTVHNFQTKF